MTLQVYSQQPSVLRQQCCFKVQYINFMPLFMSKNSKPIWPHWPWYVTLNFDRLTHMKYMLGVNLNKFPQGVSEILCSQKCNVIWPHWPWLMTYGHQNLISLSLSPSGCCSRSDEISSRGSLKYYIHKNRAASQHIDLDLWPWPLDLQPSKSSQRILELRWMFVTNLKKFPQGIFEMLRSQESDRRTTWKHDAFWHNFSGAEPGRKPGCVELDFVTWQN